MFMRDTNVINSFIHLYRGEMGRMVAYRARLDTTTNWAVVTTAAMTTFALGNPEVSHVVFLFAMFLNYFFLHLETRRFRLYELSHRRMRLLERHFYKEMLGSPAEHNWQDQLLKDLQNPSMPISQLDALGWRIRRNYIWLYAAVLLAWLMKLSSRGGNFVEAAQAGTLPGLLIISLVVVFYAILIALGIRAGLSHQLEDD